MNINRIQEQILISGKIGDGNYKKNGSNYYYRENHSKRELEYLTWKYNHLKELSTPRGIIHEKPKGFSKDGVYSFSTITNSIFNKYANMTIEECIKQLNDLGLILFLLDDGWVATGQYIRNWKFFISGGSLNINQLELICKQFEIFDIYNCHIIGNKRKDISIPKENNKKLFQYVKKYIPTNINIIQKKFRYILS